MILLGPFHPALEMPRFYLITICNLATEVSVNLVQVQPVSSGNERHRFDQIGTQFVNVARPTGIITRDLNSSRKAASQILESMHIVGLPAVQRNRQLSYLRQGFIRIDTDRRITFFCDLIRFLDYLFFHNIMICLFVVQYSIFYRVVPSG